MFGELVAVRNRVYDLLEVTQRLAQRRDLSGAAEAERLGAQIEDFRATSALHHLPAG